MAKVAVLLESPAVAAALVKPLVLRLRPDRRNWNHREALIRRLKGEFQEIPGLCLTPAHAARLFGIPLEICERVLRVLVEVEALTVRSDGSYVKRGSR
jgi:hypothetical protein